MATSVSSNTYTYTFAQNVVFLSDNLRNSLQEVIGSEVMRLKAHRGGCSEFRVTGLV